MRRDLLAFIIGLAAGAVLGMLVGDQDKQRVQAALGKQARRLRKKYEDLSQEGIDIVKEGVEKVKGLKKEYLG